MPKDAVVAKLTGAEREYSFGGKDKRIVKATSRSGDTIKVKLTYTTGPLGTANCEARVEAIDEEWSRVTPVCPAGSSAGDKLQAEINEMQVDEWVLAVLYNREVDSAMVLKRTSAVAIDNIGELSKEAAAEIEKAESAYADQASAADWGSEGGSDWGN